MRYIIFDIETDNLLDKVSKIHCLSYQIIENDNVVKKNTLINYSDIKAFFENSKDILVGHNIIRYDIPVVEKLLGISYTGKKIDTLAISWYLFPEKNKHGLEVYGEEFNVPKPKINDWKNLTIKEYSHRCETDVEINKILWLNEKKYLELLYPTGINRIIGYLNFKFDSLLEQETVGITLDINLCNKTKKDLESIIDEKTKNLIKAMPKDLGKIIRSKPANIYKKDGELSAIGKKWLIYLNNNNLLLDSTEVREDPNPGSNLQLKTWLYRLGWKPITFKVSKNTGEKVAQVSLPFGQGLCQSVKDLYTIEPRLKELDGLFLAQHRLGLIKSYLDCIDENGKVYATAHKFTNTLRMAHSKPIVNLPGFSKEWGKEIRGCLTVPSEAHIMFGADISALEDSTKQHYMFYFDADYVTQMRVPGFDPHLDIAVLGKLLTKEQAETYKLLDKKENRTEEENKLFFSLKEIRATAKVVNFAGVYGAGPAKIAETLKKDLPFATKLHDAYWKRNKAVKQVTASVTTKEVCGQKWLYNPVSGFWLFLKQDKDKFSTLNQSTGVYVFDTWLKKSRKIFKKYNIHVVLQYHDEYLGICLKYQKPLVEKIIKKAMEEANEELSLNIKIKNSLDWGKNYAECH